MRLTDHEVVVVKQAVAYYKDGDPIKDAFLDDDEDEIAVKCMKIALVASEKTMTIDRHTAEGISRPEAKLHFGMFLTPLEQHVSTFNDERRANGQTAQQLAAKNGTTFSYELERESRLSQAGADARASRDPVKSQLDARIAVARIALDPTSDTAQVLGAAIGYAMAHGNPSVRLAASRAASEFIRTPRDRDREREAATKSRMEARIAAWKAQARLERDREIEIIEELKPR